MSGASTPFRVLTVCTGNICRSPAAGFLLMDEFTRAGRGLDVVVESAGTRPLEGRPVDPAMARLLAERGIDPTGFAARRLDKRLVRDADLVLGMTRDHRTRAVQLYPGVLKRAFTLRELARLADRVDPAELDVVAGPDADLQRRLRVLLQLAPRHRTPVAPELDDVNDPYGHGDDVFAAVFDQLADAVGSLARVVVPIRA